LYYVQNSQEISDYDFDQLLKKLEQLEQEFPEHANRYTCEGRLTGFSPLKKIDKKISDKKLTMSYADFKRMKKEEQNKK
jgi:NAD-dependent DNA ligase